MKELHDAYDAAIAHAAKAAAEYVAAIRAELPPGNWRVGPGLVYERDLDLSLNFTGDLWHATTYDGERKIRGHAPTINAALLALDVCRSGKSQRTG